MMKRLILSSVLGAFLLVVISAAMPVYEPVERTQASQPVTECPPNTDKGAYHIRGYDKDGNAMCGFTYYNECPYYAGAEAGTPECEKGKPTPEQLEPWQPEEKASEITATPGTVKPNQCGGK